MVFLQECSLEEEEATSINEAPNPINGAAKFKLIVILSIKIAKGLATTLMDLFTDMSLVLLYASFAANFYEYDNWSEVFPDLFGTDLWNNIEDELHGPKHWYGMTYQELLFYTSVPVGLTLTLNLIECLEFVFSRKGPVPNRFGSHQIEHEGFQKRVVGVGPLRPRGMVEGAGG